MARYRIWPESSLTLRQREAIWGYLFVALPMIGFVVFAAGPLIASIILSFAQWDLLRDPKWVGFDNWNTLLTLTVKHLPQEIDEATGEPLFLCARERVPQSQAREMEGQIDPRTGKAIECEPRYMRERDVLPQGYRTALEFSLFNRRYVIGSRDPGFWEGLYNTSYMLLGIPVSMAIALLLAMALNQKIHGKSVYRMLYYLPVVLPVAATSLIWMWIYNPEFGILNYALDQLGLPSNLKWLQDRHLVKPALMIMGLWGGLGYQMLIFLAGLQGIPAQLYEAAKIDGAGMWARFRYVTWPGLTPTTFFLLVTGMIGGFQVFTQPYIMTAGGPYTASTTVVMVIWRNAFRDLQMGYASAQAWTLGVLIMLITLANFLLARRWVYLETEGARA
jgi:multiple sugar transport system permease protein